MQSPRLQRPQAIGYNDWSNTVVDDDQWRKIANGAERKTTSRSNSVG